MKLFSVYPGRVLFADLPSTRRDLNTVGLVLAGLVLASLVVLLVLAAEVYAWWRAFVSIRGELAKAAELAAEALAPPAAPDELLEEHIPPAPSED